jgi:predicted component of type VI protein secretion system
MPPRLVPLSGGVSPSPIVLQRPVLLVGRHPECDIRIDRPEISRRHCCVAQAYDRLTVRDLGSRNGVRVNGRRVFEIQLRPGDEIAIAQVIYRVESDSPSPPVESPGRNDARPPGFPELPEDDDPIPDFGLVPLDDG